VKIYLRNLITSHITTSPIRLIIKVRATGIKPIATGKRITLSQDHDAIGAILASFMITNTMKQTVLIPIPPFDEAVLTALLAICLILPGVIIMAFLTCHIVFFGVPVSVNYSFSKHS
jgi:hypothetical protein